MAHLNPRVDIAFKKIFGVEENKDLLIALINAIVSKEDEVADITLLNPYNPKHFQSDKLSILAIKARGVTGKLFNIEMQISDEKDYTKQAQYYWAKLYTEQLKQGAHYQCLNKAIGIHILNFISITNTDRYHNRFHIVEAQSGERYFQDFELHTIELKKFDAQGVQAVDELVKKIHTALDMWVAFLTRHDLLEVDHLPGSLNQLILNKALKVMERLNLSDPEREMYEAHLVRLT